MRRMLLVLLGLLTTSAEVLGTAQSMDWLICDGKFFQIADQPLKTFPWTSGEHPSFELAPGLSRSSQVRGYLAIWEIRDDRLYLAGLDSFVDVPENERLEPELDDDTAWSWMDDVQRVSLKTLFPTRFKDGRVFADWFTGTLRVPHGKMLAYVHSDYQSVYEEDILLHFEGGLLKKSEKRKNSVPQEGLSRAEEGTPPNQ